MRWQDEDLWIEFRIGYRTDCQRFGEGAAHSPGSGLPAKVKTEWKRDAYREVNSKLLRFRNLVFDLTLEGTFLKKSAASSRPDLLTATASGAATEGTWEIVVKKLASAARQVSELPEDLPGGFSFVIRTSPEKLATITIEDGDGLEQIAAKINKAQVGINAFAHDGQISFTTTATGQDAAIYVDQAFTELFGGELGALAQVPGEDGEPPWSVSGPWRARLSAAPMPK